MSGHPRDELAALVDGELGHAARERVLAHLAGCGSCREEVELQRRLKARLREQAEPDAPDPDLLARLLDVPALPAAPGRADRALRPPAPGGPRRPPHRSRRRRTRTALGLSALALGTLAVLGLGGSPVGPRPAVDPVGDDLLVDHAGSTAELPLPDPAGAVQAGLTR